MTKEIGLIHKDLAEIKKRIIFIQNILAENYELSDETKKQLELASKTPLSEYIDQDEVKKQLLQ